MAMNYDRATALRIKAWLMAHGMTENGTYGLMANIYVESGFRANNLQNSYVRKLGLSDEQYTAAVDSNQYANFTQDHAGYGLCQWTYWSRKQNLLNYARSVGKSIGDEEMQLEYLLNELRDRYPTVLRLLTASNDERECAIRVMLDFERPANQSEENQVKRADHATELKSSLKEEPKMGIKVAIDAGHGLYTSGKRCMKALDPNETREWALNSRIAEKLEKLLLEYGCEVIRVDDRTGRIDTSLDCRVAVANRNNCNVYISIHHNAGIKGGTGGGTVVYHYCSSGGGILMATKLYNAIVKETGLVGNRSTKVKKTAYHVLKNTNMRAYLIENGFMDSATDVPIILTDAHAENTARGIMNCLIAEYGLKDGYPIPAPEPEPVVGTFRVRVIDDALNIRKGPGTNYDIVGCIKDHGVYTITEVDGNWGKLKSGLGWINIKPIYVTRL